MLAGWCYARPNQLSDVIFLTVHLDGSPDSPPERDSGSQTLNRKPIAS